MSAEMALCENMYGTEGPVYRITKRKHMYPPRFEYFVYCRNERIATVDTFTDAIRAIPYRREESA